MIVGGGSLGVYIAIKVSSGIGILTSNKAE